MSLTTDLQSLERLLAPVAEQSRALPWAKERAWRPSTHLSASNGLPAIDLHDLSVRLALDALRIAIDADLGTGGFVLVTGRGRHTGGHSKLRDAVLDALTERRDRGELAFRPLGPGRVEVVMAEDRVKAARPGLGLVFWLLVALVALAVIAAILNRLG